MKILKRKLVKIFCEMFEKKLKIYLQSLAKKRVYTNGLKKNDLKFFSEVVF